MFLFRSSELSRLPCFARTQRKENGSGSVRMSLISWINLVARPSQNHQDFNNYCDVNNTAK